jgi:hypothetical protein
VLEAATYWKVPGIVGAEDGAAIPVDLVETIGEGSWPQARGTVGVRVAHRIFCILVLFRFYFHNYTLFSFISKNGLSPQRHHYWRRATTCRRQLV